jgi:hypothetical protein
MHASFWTTFWAEFLLKKKFETSIQRKSGRREKMEQKRMRI